MSETDQNNNNEDVDAIEEEEWTDDDSALGSEWPSSTQSLSSTMWNYTYENGRRYHAHQVLICTPGNHPKPILGFA
jgi:hypothetical protein